LLFVSTPVRVVYPHGAPRAIPSFPTRRSSDLGRPEEAAPDRSGGGGDREEFVRELHRAAVAGGDELHEQPVAVLHLAGGRERDRDRKSTRLNSSHVQISYAVFCLKNKNKARKI